MPWTKTDRPRFAMLTSKPPFQSSTTDEIYRRARERDYEWPSPESTQKYISPEAKDLVATMLEDADMRPDTDTIVEHPFFTSGYMPHPSDMNPKLRDFPPEASTFYEPLRGSTAITTNTRNVRDMCRECGVGPWNDSQLIYKNIWREMADEETHGLTPAIPLAEGIVYRPYDEIRAEQKLQSRAALPAQQARHVGQSCRVTDRSDEPSSVSRSALPPRSAPVGLLSRAPQSFAAQQRQQARPVASGATLLRAPSTGEATSRSGTVRSSVRREPQVTAESKDAKAPDPIMRPVRATRNGSATYRSQKQVSGAAEDKAPAQKPTLSRQQPMEERVSLFSPSESQEEIPGTKPDVVLGRLRKLQAELERALNARTMAIVSPKDKTPSPPHIVVKWVDYTNKFGLGYILNDGSVGCILRTIPTKDGSRTGYLPPACLLVHGAEHHCLRRDDPRYPDRHQIVPMSEAIYFYENNGEDGLARVRVEPETFAIPTNADGTAGKLSAGVDIYDHRKRERIVLWKKFANYMIAYGREIDGSDPGHGGEAARGATSGRDSRTPSDIVTFYQRFGDVGCWMFCDGHMQVCVQGSTGTTDCSG